MSKDFNSDIKRQGTPASMFFQAAPQNAAEGQEKATEDQIREKIRQEERAKIYAEIGRETKSKKLQLLIYPSLYRDIKALADKEGASVNNYINEVLRVHRDSMKDKAEANR